MEDFELPGVPAAKLDKITMKVVAPPRAAQDVLGGKLDYMQDPPPPDLLREVRSHADRYREVPTEGTSYFSLNSSVPPFDKVAVRRAVNLGIGEDALARVYGGLLGAHLQLPATRNTRRTRSRSCPYGEPGKSTDIARPGAWCGRRAQGSGGEGLGPQQDPGPAAMSYLADVLDQIGLDAKVSLVDFAVYSQTLGNLRTHPQTAFMSWAGDYPHPYTFLRQFDAAAITATNNFNIGEVQRSRDRCRARAG